jgi:hypothetical protein
MRISFKIENNIGIIWPWNSPHIEDEILEAAPNNTPWPKPQRQKPPRRSDCLSQPTASLPFRFSATSGGRRPAMAAPPSPRSPKAQSVGGDAPLSLFLDTDLGTRLALLAAPDTTISRLKCTGLTPRPLPLPWIEGHRNWYLCWTLCSAGVRGARRVVPRHRPCRSQVLPGAISWLWSAFIFSESMWL